MGKGGKIEQKEKQEVLIDGTFYDVSKMKHPGGSVIDFYAGKGIDATEAFSNFHIRSKKARKIMGTLPSRPADLQALEKEALPGQTELMKDFDKLTRELEAEGFFKPSLPHVVYRITELLALYVAGFYFLLNGQIILGLVLTGVAQGRCGWYVVLSGLCSSLATYIAVFFSFVILSASAYSAASERLLPPSIFYLTLFSMPSIANHRSLLAPRCSPLLTIAHRC